MIKIILLWLTPAAFTMTIHVTMIANRLTGKLGERHRIRDAYLLGKCGADFFFTVLFLFDLFLWPAALVWCARAVIRGKRTARDLASGSGGRQPSG